MIRTEHIIKRYALSGQPVEALRGISLHIRPGEYAAIVGPSGSGKSTLMNILGCLDRPSEGAYYLHGRDVSTLTPEELAQVRGREIGFVFQGYQLLPRLTAIENVALPLILCGVPVQQRLARAEALLTRVGLGHRLRHLPGQLSGGQQQRVAIARAIATRPPIIMADEPTGALDSKTGRHVLEILRELNREGSTIILITHDDGIAAQARRRVRLSDGRIVSDEVSKEAAV